MKRKISVATSIIAIAAIIGVFVWGTVREPMTDDSIARQDSQQPAADPEGNRQPVTVSPADRPIRYLTMLTHHEFAGAITQAVVDMNIDWLEMDKPYAFRVERDFHYIYYWGDGRGSYTDRDDIALRLRIALMAGQGPDIIMMCPAFFTLGYFDYHSLINSGFVRDIYTLMDADPNTHRDEFFHTALSAFEVGGGLYSFPFSFGFQYLGVNAALPQEFIDRFTNKSSITFIEMMEFYLDLMEEHYEEFGHLAFGTGGSLNWRPYSMLQSLMYEFIDFDTRRSSLTDPRFIEVLELVRKINAHWADWEWMYPDFLSTWSRLSQGPIARTAMQELAQGVVFVNNSTSINKFYAFLEVEEPFFLHYIPIVDEGGRLLIYQGQGSTRSQVWAEVLITAGSNAELAWEFTRYLTYAFANPNSVAKICTIGNREVMWGSNSLATPIRHSMFEEHTQRAFEHIFQTWSVPCFRADGMQTFVGLEDWDFRTRQFERGVSRIAAYNQRPMRRLHPMIPPRLLEDHLDQFMVGLIDAQTAAHRMNNAVTLWLIE